MPPRKGLGKDPFAALETGTRPVLTEVPPLSEVDLETTTISIADIEASDTFNARSTYNDDEIEALAESIKKEGLLNPLTVRHRPHRKPAFFLVAGFKRLRALRTLEQSHVPVRLCRTERDADAYLLNLAENTSGRSDLTPADIALRCAWLGETYGLSGAEIAERVKLSKAHVNNLIRLTKQLHPEVLQAFRDNHPSAKVLRLVAICARSHEDQLSAWQDLVRMDGRADARAEKGPSESKPIDPSRRVKPTQLVLQRAAEALRSGAKADASDEWRKGFSEALSWVLGEADPPALGVDLSVKRGRPAQSSEG